MRGVIQKWRATALVLIVVTFSIWSIGSSKSLQQCIRDTKHQEASNTVEIGAAYFSALFNRYKGCTSFFISENKDAIGAVSTFVIAVFTATLWFATVRLWQASEEHSRHLERAARAAQTSADAAKVAAAAAQKGADVAERALFTIERPRLFPEKLRGFWVNSSGNADDPYDDKVAGFRILYRIANYGRTPAILTRMNWTVVRPDQFRPRPEYGAGRTETSGEIIPHARKGKLRSIEFPNQNGWPEKRPPRGDNSGQMIVFGFMVYDDIWGNQYRKGYGFVFVNGEPDEFRIRGGKEYNSEVQQVFVVYDEPEDS